MEKYVKQLAAVTALAMLGTTAEASILGATGGSEVIVSFVNPLDGSSISFDAGVTSLTAGQSIALPAAVLTFIDGAGGLSGVQYGMISANTTTRRYQTSSSLADFAELAEIGNSQRLAAFQPAINQLIQNLNDQVVPATGTAVNDVYGPFLPGEGVNYLDGGYDTWRTGLFNLSNLGTASDPLYLYAVQFASGSSQLGFATVTALQSGGVPLLARISNGAIDVSVVPVPAAAWLFASSLGLLGLARRRNLAA